MGEPLHLSPDPSIYTQPGFDMEECPMFKSAFVAALLAAGSLTGANAATVGVGYDNVGIDASPGLLISVQK